jgi:hypothetical protein
MYCPEMDDAEHTLFKCPRWVAERTQVEADIETSITPENMIEEMISSGKSWDRIKIFDESVMKKKLEDETRQGKFAGKALEVYIEESVKQYRYARKEKSRRGL